MTPQPFSIEHSAETAIGRIATAAARPILTWILGLRTFRDLYSRPPASEHESFADRALRTLEIEPRVDDGSLDRIPASGPVIVAANHPHGAADGLALCSILRRRRADVRILANYFLARIPELAQQCFFVDPFGGAAAAARSHTGLRSAHLWLRNGGVLIIFPSGEVAHRPDTNSRSRLDPPWQATVGRLALATGASVVPAFIDGANSRLFYAAGRVHPSLRTLLLARELLKKRGDAITVRMGAPLSARDFGLVDNPVAATTLIRRRVESLNSTHEISDAAVDTIQSEIEQLPDDACLVESGPFQVFLTAASPIPLTLREIGRLREATYRAIGEGTGRDVDLDGFDGRYLHLFCWNRDRKHVVGAYRVGLTDRLMTTDGVEGLYTHTLFRYDERLIARLSPALELGRSFVRREYQKNYNALLLLWKGIGRFVALHPHYRVLFGTVSISARYSDTSHDLLMAFLEQNHLNRDLADLVQAINPRMRRAAADPVPRSIDEANKLVVAAESDGKGIPVLLRQYLKLNAKLLGFNVDPDFGDALDALMMVDLTTVDTALLNRYLGRDEAASFLSHHRPANAA